MRRREFIAALGGAAAWPLNARSQQSGKLPFIGFLGSQTPASQAHWVDAFSRRLRELGWIDGSNIQIEYRWAGGNKEHAFELATDFVRRKVDVIVTWASPIVLSAKHATSTIPIIFAVAADPVGTGLVASLARPGGNVTGLSLEHPDLAGKRLELLRELVPDFHQLAIMVNTTNPASVLDASEAKKAAQILRLNVIILEVKQAEDIARAFQQLNGRAECLYVTIDTLLFANRVRINTLALAARLPNTSSTLESAAEGGLIYYGPNFPNMFERTADLVDKVLRGAKPKDIPVEQPTKFDLVINLITAKALGLTVPVSLLARAGEVIE